MTNEGMTPLTPLTTEILQEILSDEIPRIAHAIAELIDIRHTIRQIAVACPDKATAHALMELIGADA